MDMSAIIITRNEEAQIARCLKACVRSIQKAQRDGLLGSAEIILVDSASTDQTLRIAREFPVNIIELPASWPLSAAAGRFVGLRHSLGEFILFVDGDYALDEAWLSAAIRELAAHPNAAAVCGRHVEEVTGDSILMREVAHTVQEDTGEPEGIPIGLFRRPAIDRVGGIHPFLLGGEDRDLAHRLRDAGYRIPRMQSVMGRHKWAESGALDYVTYFRSVVVWSIGDGQLARVRRGVPSIRTEARLRYGSVRHVRNHLLGIGLATLLLVNVLVALRPSLFPILLADVAFAVILGLVRVRRRWTWRETAHGFHVVLYSMIRQVGFVIGFLRRTRRPESYPTGELILQEGKTIDAGA